MNLKTYLGKPVAGAYEAYLARAERGEAQEPVTDSPVPPAGVNLADYVFMPQHNLYVAKEKTHLGSNWYDAHKLLHQENARMLTLREFADFLLLLRSGDEELRRIYNEIAEVRDPWRAEWLDADFKVINEILHINYNHRTVNAELKPQNSEPLENCLMKDCLVDLGSFNRQGLPAREGSDFNYWFPISDNNSVAGFIACSVWAILYCVGYPRSSYSALGVRLARRAAPKN